MTLLSILSTLAFAVTPPQSFSKLKEVSIGGEATIYVEPSVTCTPIDVSQQGNDTGYDGPPYYDVCTLEFGQRNIKIMFTSGPSADPYFEIYELPKKGTKLETRKILGVGATTLYIPKGNNVYAEGWCNTMFNERRKYTYNDKHFAEVKQPYMYVGMKTTVQPLGSEKPPLILYSDKSQQTRVATLPVGSEIEVLLQDSNEWYLVRTSFGLVGWTKVTMGAYDTQIGIRFAGD